MLLQISARIVAGIFSLVLFLFALLQYNDIDPELWVLMYGFSAIVPLLLVFRCYSRRLFWLCTGLCLAGFSVSVGGAYTYLVVFSATESLVQGMSPDKPYIEETRECFGAIIVLGVLLASQRLRVAIG